MPPGDAVTEYPFLSEVRLLRGLDDVQLRKVERIVRPISFVEGDVIIKEGDIGQVMYILYEGKVEVTRNLTLKVGRGSFADREKSFNTLDASAYPFFGEMALIEESGTRSATVTAQSPCKVLSISRRDFENLCNEDHTLGYVLMRNILEEVCDRLNKASTDVLKLCTALSLALER